jgi:hypothetical protein
MHYNVLIFLKYFYAIYIMLIINYIYIHKNSALLPAHDIIVN